MGGYWGGVSPSAKDILTTDERTKLLDAAERIVNGDTSTAHGSADLDYGHDLIDEVIVAVAKRMRLEAWDEGNRAGKAVPAGGVNNPYADKKKGYR